MRQQKMLPGEKARNTWVPMPLPALVPIIDVDDLIKTKIVEINEKGENGDGGEEEDEETSSYPNRG